MPLENESVVYTIHPPLGEYKPRMGVLLRKQD